MTAYRSIHLSESINITANKLPRVFSISKDLKSVSLKHGVAEQTKTVCCTSSFMHRSHVLSSRNLKWSKNFNDQWKHGLGRNQPFLPTHCSTFGMMAYDGHSVNLLHRIAFLSRLLKFLLKLLPLTLKLPQVFVLFSHKFVRRTYFAHKLRYIWVSASLAFVHLCQA